MNLAPMSRSNLSAHLSCRVRSVKTASKWCFLKRITFPLLSVKGTKCVLNDWYVIEFSSTSLLWTCSSNTFLALPLSYCPYHLSIFLPFLLSSSSSSSRSFSVKGRLAVCGHGGWSTLPLHLCHLHHCWNLGHFCWCQFQHYSHWPLRESLILAVITGTPVVLLPYCLLLTFVHLADAFIGMQSDQVLCGFVRRCTVYKAGWMLKTLAVTK